MITNSTTPFDLTLDDIRVFMDASLPDAKNLLLGMASREMQLRFLRNLECELLADDYRCNARVRWLKTPNWKKVCKYLLGGSRTSGKTSGYQQCEFLGIDPDDYRIT